MRYLEGSVTNTSASNVALDQITLNLPWLAAPATDTLVVASASNITTPTRIFPAASPEPITSGTYLQVSQGGRYALLALATWKTFRTDLTYAAGRAIVTIDGEGRRLCPGETVPLETLRFTEGDDWQRQLTDYADDLAQRHQVRLKPRRTFVGWPTWDYYGRNWTMQNVRDNLAALLAVEPRANLLQVDGGWWPRRGEYRTERDNLKATSVERLHLGLQAYRAGMGDDA